jgi:putative transposase
MWRKRRVPDRVQHDEALSWSRPLQAHLGLANATIPTFERAEILPLS